MRKKQQAIVPASVEPFTTTFGDLLDVANHDHNLYVSIKRVCEHLGVAYQSQHAKLRAESWACVTMIVMHDTTGRSQETACVNIKHLPMWLATLQVKRVKPEIREKLQWYKEQARDVLAKAFLPTFEEAAHEVCDDLSEIKEGMKVVTAIAPLVYANEAQIAALQAEVTYLKAAVKDTLLALKEAHEEAEFGSPKRPFKKPFTFSSAMAWLFGGAA